MQITNNLKIADLTKFGINKKTTELLKVYENEENIFINVKDEMGIETGSIIFNKRNSNIEIPNFTNEPFCQELFNPKNKEVIITDSFMDFVTLTQMFKCTKTVYYINSSDVLSSYSLYFNDKKVSVINNQKTYLNDVEKYVKFENITKVKLPENKTINRLFIEKEYTVIENLLAGKDIQDGLNLVNTDDLFVNGLKFEVANRSFPFDGLNELTDGGLKSKEIMFIVAGSAGGKTDFGFRIMKSLVDQGDKVGIFAMEQKYTQEVLFQMASYEGEFKYSVKDIMNNSNNVNSPEMTKYLDRIKNFHKNVMIFDTSKVNLTVENIEVYIRNFVRVGGCKHIMIDHITFFSHQAGAKGVDLVGQFVSKLVNLSQELDCTFIITTQVHKMGGKGADAENGAQISPGDIFGSSAIFHAGTVVLSLERNSGAEDPEVQNTTTCRILKNRYNSSSMGKTFELWYDIETGQKYDKSKRAEKEYIRTFEVNKVPY